MRYIFDNRHELILSAKYSPYQIADKAVQAFYDYIERPFPDWLKLWVEDKMLEEFDLDEASLIRSILYNHVNKTFRDNLRIFDLSEKNEGNVNLDARISKCLEADVWPWIRQLSPHERQAGVFELAIDTSIMDVFSWRLPNLTFKKLAEKMGFTHERDHYGRNRILCSRKAFMDFIEGNDENDNITNENGEIQN